MENAIEIGAIIKEYEGFKLEISNVKIHHGEKVGIIGNNGMGKTTLLLSTLNLLATRKNDILIYGIPNIQDRWKNVVSAFIDSSFLIDFLSLTEYVQFICSFHKIEKSSINKLLIKFKDFLGESYDANKLIRDHSLGNARKAGIVGCLTPEVECYILDEPFENLDPRSRNRFIELINTHFIEKTLIVSSHDLNHVYQICERFIVLKDGKVANDFLKNSISESELEQYVI